MIHNRHFYRHIPCEDHLKQSYAVSIIRHEVAFDIEMFVTTVCKLHFAESSNKDKKEVVLSAQSEDWLDRTIQTALANIKRTIRFAIPRSSRMASDAILETKQDYHLPLYFEKEWDEDPQTLCDAIHDYIVSYAIAQWSLGALPDSYNLLYLTAQDKLANVHDIACTYSVNTTTPFI